MPEENETHEATQSAASLGSIEDDETAMRLLTGMLAGEIVSIRPQLDFGSETGFTYPTVEHALNTTSKQLAPVLESLAGRGILKSEFFEKLIHCPRCRSVNLRPSTHCARCGSTDIVRGRVLEHLVCKHIGVEDEFAARGKYVCPGCKAELRTDGVDYRSMGVQRKCRACNQVFDVPLFKWSCLKCSVLSNEEEVRETRVYSYRLDEARRSWLEFEIRLKGQFIEFLQQRGYRVTRNARVEGRSGAAHSIDILATRDVGIVTHRIAVEVDLGRNRIELDRIFDFDTKAYDSGFHDKMLIVVAELSGEAASFARQQRIRVLRASELESMLSGGAPSPVGEGVEGPFQFQSRSQLVQHLEKQGYTVRENAGIQGRSGATHSIDILATRDDGVIAHRIAIGTAVGDRPVGLESVFAFDDKAYDARIMDKVFIAVPRLSAEAAEFARQQRIHVLEVKQLDPPGEESAEPPAP